MAGNRQRVDARPDAVIRQRKLPLSKPDPDHIRRSFATNTIMSDRPASFGISTLFRREDVRHRPHHAEES